MATFVIVHGGFGGGWEWTPVSRLLRQAAHEVFTPTLTGMGERSHLGPRVSLSTHIQDVVSVLEFEDLRNVVLCGASYGGMAVTGAADRVPERIALVVYIDALVPSHGKSGIDLLPATFEEVVKASIDDEGHGWVSVPPEILPREDLVPEEVRELYVARLRAQPAATFLEPIRLSGAVEQLPRAFIRCTLREMAGIGDPIEPMAVRARAEGWPYRELSLPHDPHLFDPENVAAALDELSLLVQH